MTTSYIDAWLLKVKSPDLFDFGGALAGASDSLMKDVGTVAKGIQTNSLTPSDVQMARATFERFAELLNGLNGQLVNILASSEADSEFARSFKELIRQTNSGLAIIRNAATEAATGNSAAMEKFASGASTVLKQFGAWLGLVQIAIEVGHVAEINDLEAVGEKAVGVLAGFAVAEGIGFVVAGLGASVSLPVIVLAAVTVGASVGLGYLAGKSWEIMWPSASQHYRDLLSGYIFPIIEQKMSDLDIAMGRFDGTWLEGLEGVSAADKAWFSILFSGVAGLQPSAAMSADIVKVFSAFTDVESGSTALVGRDLVLKTIFLFAKDNGYATERVTVAEDGGSLTLALANFPTAALSGLQDYIRQTLSEQDQVGFSLTPPSRITIAITTGTITADANADLIVGTAGADVIDAAAGDDVVVAGAGADSIKGGAGLDALFGGDGADTLEGGPGGDYLFGGAGDDRYQLASGELFDVIRDSDGTGTIWISGVQLTGGNKAAEGLWISADEQWRFATVGSDLVVSRFGGVDSITIRDWSTMAGNRLGITLQDGTTTPAQPPGHIVTDPSASTPGDDWIQGSMDRDIVEARQGGNDSIDGYGDDDILMAGPGNDTLAGGTNNDLLDGGAGDDSLKGDLGDDVILAGIGADTIEGGAGNDLIMGSFEVGSTVFWLPKPDGANVLGEGNGWSWYQPAGEVDAFGFPVHEEWGFTRDVQDEDAANLIEAGDGNDFVFAGSANDYVDGGEGSDQVWGMQGSDVLLGGAGRDELVGDTYPHLVLRLGEWVLLHPSAEEHGADYIDGGADNDVILGLGKNDELYGGTGDDLIWADDYELENTPAAFHGDDYVDGEAGSDTVIGGAGNDDIFGGTEADALYGDAGNVVETAATFISLDAHGLDYLDGEEGNDTLFGEGGNDELFGGADDDQMLGDDHAGTAGEHHGSDYLDGEAGSDSMSGGGRGDTLYGGDGNDSLMGDDAVSVLAATAHGPDYLDGEGGADTLHGGGDNDRLFGGDGNDRLFGDSSDVPVASQGNDYLDGEAGDDTLAGQGGRDTLIGGDGNDSLVGDDTTIGGQDHQGDYLAGEAGNDTIFGQGGADTLSGGAGNDSLYGDLLSLAAGYHGADVLYGDEGDDQIVGGGGADALYGGDGNDTLYGDNEDESAPSADFLDGGDGDDMLVGHGGNDTLAGGFGNDTLFGQSGDDELDGGDGVDQLQGGDGNDTLWGEGTDSLFGQAGDDVLIGDAAGSVYLSGGDGNDSLSHGATMVGGLGDDTISVNVDSVYDGGAGNDTYRIQLSDLTPQLATAELIRDPLGANRIVLEGAIDLSAMNLKTTGHYPGSGWASSALVLHTGSGLLGIEGLQDGTIASVEVNGNVYSAKSFYSKTWAFAINATYPGYGTFTGGRLNDTITGQSGNTTMLGGLGDDTLNATGGRNTFVYDAGDGVDMINDTSLLSAQASTLALGYGITPQNVRLSATADSLVVYVDGAAGAVNIRNFNPDNAAQRSAIDRFTFLDGTVLTHAQLIERGFDVVGTASGEQVRGTNLADRLNGGAGADTLSGKSGADTYTFNAGDGIDLIADGDAAAGTGDALVFGAGFDPLRVVAVRSGNDVTFLVPGTSDEVTLKDYFAGGADAVEQIRFADGSSWTQADVLAAIDRGNADLVLHGDENNNTLKGMGGNDDLFGGAGRDVLEGGPGNDTLTGGPDADTLFGGAGSDVYVSAEGDSESLDHVDESVGGDAGSVDTARFTDLASTDASFSIQGNDLYIAGPDATRMIVVNPFASANAANQIERFEFADGVTLSFAQVHAGLFAGSTFREFTTGTALNDTMSGNWGADTLMAGDGNDVLHGDQGFDFLEGQGGNDTLFGDAGDDTVRGGDGDDVLDGGAGWDRLDGGAGNDTYAFGIGSGMDIVTADAGGTDTVQLGAAIAAANVTLYRVSAPAAVDLGYGGDSLVIQLNGGADQLWIANYFAGGANTVEGIRFADNTVWNAATIASRLVAPTGGGTAGTLAGTSRANTFTIDHWNDVINDTTFTDADIANATVSYRLPDSVNVLNLSGALNLFAAGGSGTYHDKLTGNAGDNRFTFTVNELATHPGNDTLAGGAGNDVYVITATNVMSVQPDANPLDRGGATITEAAGAGTDTLMTGYWSATLPDNVENLILLQPNAVHRDHAFGYNNGPSDYTHRFTGNALDNVIDASLYEETASTSAWFSKRGIFPTLTAFRLDGGAGADTLIGGLWSDTYVVDNAGDVVIDLGIPDLHGVDTLETRLETSLAAQYPFIENVTLTGSSAINASGTAGANVLDGSLNPAANRLTGGAGDDTYVLGAGDTIVEQPDEGIDAVVITSLAGSTARLADHANVEHIRLASSAGTLHAEGNSGANTVTGSMAANTLKGLDGDDVLFDQHIADVTFYGTAIVAASDADRLEGGAGNDTLHSWGGADTLVGGAGDDQLVAHFAGRSVTVAMGLGGGIDTLTQDAGQTLDVTVELAQGIRQQDVQLVQANGITSVQLADGTRLDTQQANRVTLVFQDGVQLDGTAGPDLLVGGTSKDTLSGGAGNDTLAGGRGADLYLIAPGTGHDVIDDLFTASGYAAEDGASDLLQFTGGLLPAGVTVLKQVTGSATTGIVLRLDATGDSVTLMQAYAAGNVGAVEAVRFENGTQWDLATLKTLVSATIGSAGNDTLTGTAGNDVLDGAGGTDSMTGGAGNDTYYVDRAQDVIVEASGAGTDTAIASFGGYVLPANVERGQLATGTQAWGMTGNTLANALTGNAGNNRLDGGTGIDTLTGGAGNDSYVIDVAGDVVTEAQGAGWDTIESPIALTLVANVEGLKLTGTGKITGTGNGGNNALLGNSNINTLNGAAGHDILMGEGGADVLSDTAGNNALDGGAGNDTLTVSGGNDFLAGGAGNDTVTFGAGADVFAFNRGDGIDSFNAPTAGAGQGEANDTVSLGRVRFDELRFSRETSDLVIKINGTTDALRLKGWYTSAANQTVVNLQLVVETASDYAPASQELLRATRVTLLDFKELVGLYDAARAINTSLVNWQPSEAQLQAAWVSGSNSLAYGGIDAYRYAKDGTLANANFEAATNQLAAQVVGVAQAMALEA